MRGALPAVLAMVLAPLAARAAPAWTIDKAASSIRFASSLSGEAFSGVFRRWDAAIRFDPADLAGSDVAASIDVASAATGDADRDQALPTATFLDAAKFPRATFAAHVFKSLGASRYQAIGVLTLRGVAKPLTLPFSLAIAGHEAKMTASVPLNRLAFGVGGGTWAKTDALPATVTLTLALTARRP